MVIDASDLYNTLEACGGGGLFLGASSLEPLPGSQDTLFRHFHSGLMSRPCYVIVENESTCTGPGSLPPLHLAVHGPRVPSISLFSHGCNSPFVWSI